jgi:hypothetical protein
MATACDGEIGPFIVKFVQKKTKIFSMSTISNSIYTGFMTFLKVSNF